MTIALVLLLAAPQEGCIRDLPSAVPENTRLLQKSGKGLWIGGIAFDPADVAETRVVQDALTEEWTIEVYFSYRGKLKFRHAQRCGIDRPIEISFDRKLVSRPWLREEIRGVVQIASGWQRRSEVETFARRLSPPR